MELLELLKQLQEKANSYCQEFDSTKAAIQINIDNGVDYSVYYYKPSLDNPGKDRITYGASWKKSFDEAIEAIREEIQTTKQNVA